MHVEVMVFVVIALTKVFCMVIQLSILPRDCCRVVTPRVMLGCQGRRTGLLPRYAALTVGLGGSVQRQWLYVSLEG